MDARRQHIRQTKGEEDMIEIRQTKDGRIFAIKDLSIDPKTATIKASIAGDEEAAQSYLQAYVKSIIERFPNK